MKLLTVFALVLGATTANAQFKLDQSEKEVRKAQDVMALDDLAIEETGLLTFVTFCRVENTLFLPRSSLLQPSPSSFGVNYRITRKQNNSVVIEAKPGDKVDNFRKSMLAALSNALQHSCDTFGVGPDKRFEVTSINGATSLTEIEKSTR
jgi:hypothetical protein